MNFEQTQKAHELCERIGKEKDRHKFLELVEELNALLAQKGQRLKKEEESSDTCPTPPPLGTSGPEAS